MVNFASQAIILSSQQFTVFCAYPAIIPLLLSVDPKKACSGSSGTAPARSGAETQDVPRRQLSSNLYIVLSSCPVTGRSAPVKGGVVIPWAWYTSGNFVKREKSDPDGTAVL